MEYTFYAKGHKNVTSAHRSTFEVTMDREIGIRADCIVGVASKIKLEDFPHELREAIKKETNLIRVQLETENAKDEIKGYGHPELTLDHPTDMVCRKSEFKCSRTLMIKSDKAAVDLKRELVDDLKEGKDLKVTILVE
ncbi:DUF371 domain-containing protein [Methanobacterium sp. MBAC-LM]|uniref:DUF371 domain-containing protein n=1 Tax=Methanobacterium sp. MBAC-LM TaxID=3412034 RepID=UPI003C726028